MQNKNVISSLKIKHLVYFAILLITLFIRFLAASQLEVSQAEAEILLNLFQSGQANSSSGSVLYQLLTLPLVSLLGRGMPVVRFWVILAGSLFVLLPLMYEDILGSKAALILSLLLAIDPFQIANSLQINGSSLSVLLLFSTIGFTRKKKYLPAIGALLGFCLSGMYLYYGILLGILLFLTAFLKKQQAWLIEPIKDMFQYIKANLHSVCGIFLGLIMLVLLFGIKLSSVFGDFITLITGWIQPYEISSFPQLFPIALLAYLPLGVFGILFGARIKKDQEISTYLVLWIMAFLFILTFYPAHKLVDLVWVSLPLCILCALSLDEFVDQTKGSKKNLAIYTTLLTCIQISLTITLLKIVYQQNNGMNSLNVVLSAITLVILIIMMLIFIAYNENVHLAFATIRASFLIIVIFMQLSFSWRSTGMNGNPAGEILWGGYFEGADLVRNMIDNADLKVLDDEVDKQIAFVNYENMAVKWAIGAEYPYENQPFGLVNEHYAVIISSSNEGMLDDSVDGYYGQDFVSMSYPLWTWQPFKSLLSSDFWAWLFFRQGQMLREYNYIWVNKALF